MKYFKRANQYKASNVYFDVATKQAYSYNWWRFVDVINGKLIFNDYRYSPSTGKQQSKVRRLLESLGLTIDAFIECPQGLQKLDSGIDYYCRCIQKLNDAIAKPRSNRTKNRERRELIKTYQDKVAFIQINLIGELVNPKQGLQSESKGESTNG